MDQIVKLTAWPAAAGEMAELIRKHDWGSTRLGPLDSWPASLKTAVDIMLASPDPVAVMWGSQRIQLYNDAYMPIAAERHPSSLGRSAAANWDDAYEQFLGPIFERVFEGESVSVEQYAIPLRAPGGGVEERFFTGSFFPIRDETGAVAGVFHPLVEVTAKVRADELARERDERLHRVLNGMAECFGLIGPDFTILEQNAEALRLDGRPISEIVGRSHWEAYPGSENSELGRVLKRAMTERFPVSLEHQFTLDDGKPRWLEMRAYPLEDGTLAVFWHDVTERKKAEAALRLERDRSAQILESISDAFYAVDADWRFTYVNSRAEEWWGRSRADLLGKVYWEEFPQAVGSEPYRAHLRAAETREVAQLQTVSPILGRWVDISIYPTTDGGLSVYFRDISEQKESERRVDETSRRLDAILNNTREAVFLMDDKQECVFANAAAEELTGYSFPEMRGRPLHDVVHHKRPDGSHYPLEECPIDRAFPERAQVTGEELFVHKDGSFYPVAFTASPLLDDAGKPVGTVIEARNIAEQRARDAALRESEARLRALTDNLPGGMVFQIATGRDGGERRFLHVSQSVEKLTGITADAILANPEIAYNLILPEERERLAIAEVAAIENRAPFDAEVQFRRADGEVRWCRIISAPREQPDGSLIWDGIQIDTTEQKCTEAALRDLNETLEIRVRQRTAELEQAHEQLRQSQKLEAMGNLTGGVAHDFNNLLSPIIGSLDLLQRKGLGGPREQRLLDGALQSAERARVLVQRLLAFARRQPLQPQQLDVGALVAGMADLVASTTGPQIKVVVSVADDVPSAIADPNQIEMAILNLSVNARDAMPEGGTLRICADRVTVTEGHEAELPPGDYLRLSVADTGIGMDESTRARAVEPFFSTKGVGRGTGLGLSMVHGLAGQLGGALTIKSKPGAGTDVQIWLPAIEGAPSQPASRNSSSARSGTATVLVVDDEDLVRSSTSEMLADLGYSVIEADSAAAALRLLDEGASFDVLVTDHLMPGMNGTELARRVQERRPEISVLIISGYADVDGIVPDLNRLNKPFRQVELASKLDELEKSAAAARQ